MTDAESASVERLVIIARAVKTRGLKGEIVADLLTDFPERFEQLREVVAVGPGQPRLVVELEDHWFQKGRVILKLKGYDSIESAAQLLGYHFAVPEADRVQLTEGSYYDWELEGCKVETNSEMPVGIVTGVLRTGGVALLAVHDPERREILIPMAEAIVVEIDIDNKRIVIDPPAGLLDL